MRGFDHLVLCVNDLERARASYAALGFTLTPPAAHPFGTRNSLAQFAGGNFIELLAIGDRSAIPPHAPGRFSFAAFNAAFLERCGEGASMLALAGSDARADAAAFRASGLDTYAPFDFGRDAIQPDGGVARVGFSLAFVTHAAMPDAAFFTCQHRHPAELFWKPEYQRHANGAAGLAEIVVSARDPSAWRDFFRRLMAGTSAAGTDGLRFGPLLMLSADEARRRWPGCCLTASGSPRILGVRVTTRDLGVARARLERQAIPFRIAGNAVVIPPGFAHGICLEISEAR